MLIQLEQPETYSFQMSLPQWTNQPAGCDCDPNKEHLNGLSFWNCWLLRIKCTCSCTCLYQCCTWWVLVYLYLSTSTRIQYQHCLPLVAAWRCQPWTAAWLPSRSTYSKAASSTSTAVPSCTDSMASVTSSPQCQRNFMTMKWFTISVSWTWSVNKMHQSNEDGSVFFNHHLIWPMILLQNSLFIPVCKFVIPCS